MNETELSKAIKTLVAALESEGKEPGSYYYVWQANIAMSMHDAARDWADNHNGGVLPHEWHEVYNNGAKCFLDTLLITTNYKPRSGSL